MFVMAKFGVMNVKRLQIQKLAKLKLMSTARVLSLKTFLEQFQRNANGIATRYGGPVFLVGGACTGHVNDWDIICVLSHEEMRRNFGPSYGKDGRRSLNYLFQYAEWETKKAYYELKTSRLMSKRMCLMIDFKIQSVNEARSKTYLGKPSVRCDGLEDWVFAPNKLPA